MKEFGERVTGAHESVPTSDTMDARPMTIGEMVDKWTGVFEDEFWEEVLRAREPVRPRASKARR